jgi:hypothetical protein
VILRVLLAILLLVMPTLAQAGFIVSPPGVTCANQTQITAPVAGQDYCFESTSQTINGWNGSAWSSIVTAGGAYEVRGLSSAYNAGTPNTKHDIYADLVQLRSPSSGTVVVRANTGVITNDTGVVGPAANGRDQSAAFNSSTWIHFYFIWNGTTLATLSSTVAPPTGPTLPTGYTHWAYATAVFYDATPKLVKTRTRGSNAFFELRNVILNAGNATSETNISLATVMPPNALVVWLELESAAAVITRFRIVPGTDFVALAASAGADRALYPVPAIAQNIIYINDAGGGSANIVAMGYQVANGGE